MIIPHLSYQILSHGQYLGYSKITSNYGPRKAPAIGSSSFHYGIDIAAPTGTNLVSAINGYVIYADFNGANGYTIKIENNDYIISYSHVSPNFIVNIGDFVKAGEIIGNVGPKYLENNLVSKYTDSSGKPTNGATTGAHLHFCIKKEGKYVNPLDYLVMEL